MKFKDKRSAWAKEFEKSVEKKLTTMCLTRGSIIEAFIAETGIRPSEAVLVEERQNDGGFRFYIRKRKDYENDKCRNCGTLRSPL